MTTETIFQHRKNYPISSVMNDLTSAGLPDKYLIELIDKACEGKPKTKRKQISLVGQIAPCSIDKKIQPVISRMLTRAHTAQSLSRCLVLFDAELYEQVCTEVILSGTGTLVSIGAVQIAKAQAMQILHNKSGLHQLIQQTDYIGIPDLSSDASVRIFNNDHSAFADLYTMLRFMRYSCKSCFILSLPELKGSRNLFNGLSEIYGETLASVVLEGHTVVQA